MIGFPFEKIISYLSKEENMGCGTEEKPSRICKNCKNMVY